MTQRAMRGTILVGVAALAFCTAAAAAYTDFSRIGSFRNQFDDTQTRLHGGQAADAARCSGSSYCNEDLGAGVALLIVDEGYGASITFASLSRGLDDTAGEARFGEAADALVAVLSPQVGDADRSALLAAVLEDYRKTGRGRAVREKVTYEMWSNAHREICFGAMPGLS